MERNVRRAILNLVVVASALVLTACHKPPSPPQGVHPLTPYQRKLVSEIRSSGAKVIKQAGVLQIVLPTDRFFRRGTTQLKSHKRYAVSRVATLVKNYSASYAHPRITVTGYTDQVFARKTQKKLSLQYAREIAAYLWHRGVSGVRVYGAGAGSPIASNRTVRGAAYNRRVVVQVS